MESVLVGAFLLISITFCATVFHLVPILSKTDQRSLVTNEELLELSQQLFDADEHDFLSQVVIRYQGFLNTSNINDDRAPGPLLTVNEEIENFESIRKMKVLYDNFEANSSIDEIVNIDEENEENDFIHSLLKTPVMNLTMNFLQSKGAVSDDPKEQHEFIRRIWFGFYPRNKNTNQTSSGFEHVFLSEVKKGKIIGLHNWIYFAEAEKKGELNYKGWVKNVDLGKKAKIAKVKFSLNGLNKSVSSFFIGTSPELEFAIFTICFQFRANKKCQMTFNGVNFDISTYTFIHEKKRFIASAYVNV